MIVIIVYSFRVMYSFKVFNLKIFILILFEEYFIFFVGTQRRVRVSSYFSEKLQVFE